MLFANTTTNSSKTQGNQATCPTSSSLTIVRVLPIPPLTLTPDILPIRPNSNQLNLGHARRIHVPPIVHSITLHRPVLLARSILDHANGVPGEPPRFITVLNSH